MLKKGISKIIGKGGGKVATKAAGKAAGKLAAKAGAKMALRAGAGALKAIPGLGLAVTAGMAAFDAVDGWKNAASITGKKESELTTADKAKAAGASALSGLTFGLVSSQTMYKGINAVGDFAKKAFKFTPMGLGLTGMKKAWNWLTKPSKTVDQKTGKTVQGKTGLQKISDFGDNASKAIGTIGKTLFKFTPMGMALSAAKGVTGLFKPKNKKKIVSLDQKQFLELKKLIIFATKGKTAVDKLFGKKSNLKDGKEDIKDKKAINVTLKENDKLKVSKKIKEPVFSLNELSNNEKPLVTTSKDATILSENKDLMENKEPLTPIKDENIIGNKIHVEQKKPDVTMSVKSVNMIKNIEDKKLNTSAQNREESRIRRDNADKKFDLMPELIAEGISIYFNKHKFKVNEKTGQLESFPIDEGDIAPKT